MAAVGTHTATAQEKGKVVAELAASLWHAASHFRNLPASRDLTLFPKEQQQLEIRARDSLQQCSEEVLFGNMVEVCNPTLGARLMPEHTQFQTIAVIKHKILILQYQDTTAIFRIKITSKEFSALTIYPTV